VVGCSAPVAAEEQGETTSHIDGSWGGGNDEGRESAPLIPAEERPESNPFPALFVQAGVPSGSRITQCEDIDSERVWETSGTGPDPSTYWAPAKSLQRAKMGCGTAGDAGMYPLVFRGLRAGDIGAQWVVQCTGFGDGAQYVYFIDSVVDGHPAASFVDKAPNADCD
jgi:hypothetical protein